MFLGIDPRIKGWIFLDIETRKVVVARTAIFNEYRYPFIDVLKPCLIVLKFGTWPKAYTEETMGRHRLPVSNVIPEMGASEKIPEITFENEQNTSSKSNKETETENTKTNPSRILPITSENSPINSPITPLPSIQSEISPIQNSTHGENLETSIPSISPLQNEISPIEKRYSPLPESKSPFKLPLPKSPSQEVKEHNWEFNTPPKSNVPEPLEVYLDTPKISKGGLKKFNKLRSNIFGKDNMYLKSNVDQRLKIYEQKFASKEREIQKQTCRKTSSYTSYTTS